MTPRFCRHCGRPLAEKRFADAYCSRSCYRKAWCAARYKRHVQMARFIPAIRDAPPGEDDPFLIDTTPDVT